MYPVTEQTVAEIAPWPEPPPCLHDTPNRAHSTTKLPPPTSSSSWIRGTGMRRRPESVFSRRGPSTPVEEVVPITARFTAPETPRKSSKRKIGRHRFSVEDKSGTILHAVPKAIAEDLSPRAMTAAFINRSIATQSSNHSRSTSEGSSLDLPELRSEIYSISEETSAPSVKKKTVRHSRSFPSAPCLPFSPFLPSDAPKHSFLGKKKRKGFKRVDSTEVGIWRDGKAYWMPPQNSIPIVQRPEDAFIAELDSRPISVHDSRVDEDESEFRSKRPSIQLVIPEQQQRFQNFHLPNPSMSLAPALTKGPTSAPQPSAAGDLISSRPVSPQVAAKHPQVHSSMVSSLSTQYLQMRATTEAHPGNLWNPIGYTSLRQASSSTSTVSNGSVRDRDELSSNYSNSNRTSITSMDDNGEPALRPRSQIYTDARTASEIFSVGSPVAAGVFDESIPAVAEVEGCPARRLPNGRSSARQGSIQFPMAHPGQPFIPPTNKAYESAAGRLTRRASSRQKHSVPLTRRNLGAEAGPSHKGPRTKSTSSPTLSEAETALEEHLCCLSSSSVDGDDRVKPPFHESLPPPPRKSSKRKFVSKPGSVRTGHQPAPYQTRTTHNRRRSLTPRDIRPDAAESVLCGILRSCHSLDDLFSLASVNRGFYYVFKRHELEMMHTVLKNESPPAWEFRKVSYPVESGTPDSSSPKPEYTPTSFYRMHKHDKIVISALKSLVLSRCQSFLRPETVMALAIDGNERAQRMDDALWRIWTFCKLFGCGKNREDDVVGQIDWLRGGPAVHQSAIRATSLSCNSFDLSSILTNASEHFAKGNSGGLSAEELYDMTEIWTCLGVLLSGLEGRTAQAREFGVFEPTDVRGGDIDGEERMLDEWIYYLLTLGPDVVLYLASPSNNPEPDAFQIAQEKGWIKWTPPSFESSRCTFLKEAVSRVYEEKIAAMAAVHPRHNLEVRRNMRERIAAHKAEINMRKRSGHCPLVRMSMERPISDWEGVFRSLGEPQRTASLCSGRSAARHAPIPLMPELPAMEENEIRATLHTRSVSAPQPQSLVANGISTHIVSPAARNVARCSVEGPISPPMSIYPYYDAHSSFNTSQPTANQSATSVATISSVSTPGSFKSARTLFSGTPSGVSTLADHYSTILHHPKQFELTSLGELNEAAADPAQNSSEKAICRIVEMGFTAEQAKYALMKTDLGDGLRLDRAVELLLRGS